MTVSRRSLLTSPVPLLAMLPACADSAASSALATTMVSDVRSLEDFGAVGDYDPGSETGTDDTAAIQRAIDWGAGGGSDPVRAITVGARNYLCGPITVHPATTIIGTGRQSSNFWCRRGTRGDWWSDRGGGAQKLMLHGLAWYGRNEPGLSAVCRFGSGGIPFGTEGVLDSLWMRDAPNGYGLRLDANVGFVRTITVLACAVGIRVNGNGNQLDNLVAMESRQTGAHLAGSFVRGLHIEATESGGVPLRLNGDCRVHDLLISSAAKASFDHLIEIDTTNYDEWALLGVQLLGAETRILRGMIKAGERYIGGTSPADFTGASFLPALDLHGSGLSLAGQRWHAFSVEIARSNARLTHRIGAIGNPHLPTRHAPSLGTSNERFVETPATGFADGAGLVEGDGSRLAIQLARPQHTAGAAIACAIERCSAGRPLTASATLAPVTAGREPAQALVVTFRDGAHGTPFDLRTMPEGASVVVALSGFLG